MSGVPSEDDLENARRLGKRYVLGFLVLLSAAFVVVSTFQLVAGVFGLNAPGGIAASGVPDAECVQALRRWVDAQSEAPPLATCAKSSADLDAYAAAGRFALAAVSARNRGAPIAPLRHDVDAYLVP